MSSSHPQGHVKQPCRGCGGPAVVEACELMGRSWRVRCALCSVGTDWFALEDVAIEAWNDGFVRGRDTSADPSPVMECTDVGDVRTYSGDELERARLRHRSIVYNRSIPMLVRAGSLAFLAMVLGEQKRRKRGGAQ